jgi:hypothetical protein
MAELKIHRQYRTYRYIDKNPVIDRIRTIVQDEGLFKKLNIVHQLSGVSSSTLNNWFHGDTKNPQHHTIAAVVTSLGYEETFAKTKTIELERELVVAKAWLEKQKELIKQPAKRNSKKKK